jgi:hypothetical protein
MNRGEKLLEPSLPQFPLTLLVLPYLWYIFPITYERYFVDHIIHRVDLAIVISNEDDNNTINCTETLKPSKRQTEHPTSNVCTNYKLKFPYSTIFVELHNICVVHKVLSQIVSFEDQIIPIK